MRNTYWMHTFVSGDYRDPQTHFHHFNILRKHTNWLYSNWETVICAVWLRNDLCARFLVTIFASDWRKKYLQMQIWSCFMSAALLLSWEMIVLYYIVSCTHIFIKTWVDKPLIHSNTVLFPFILVRPHSTANKDKISPAEFRPTPFLHGKMQPPHSFEWWQSNRAADVQMQRPSS